MTSIYVNENANADIYVNGSKITSWSSGTAPNRYNTYTTAISVECRPKSGYVFRRWEIAFTDYEEMDYYTDNPYTVDPSEGDQDIHAQLLSSSTVSVTIKRENWGKFRYKTGLSSSWSDWYTSSSKIISVNVGDTLDVDWFTSDGSQHCYKMVTSSGYPGGGTDTVTINAAATYYPSTSNPEVQRYTVRVYKTSNYKSFYRFGVESKGDHTGTYYDYIVDAGESLDIDWQAKDDNITTEDGYTVKKIVYGKCNHMANTYRGTDLGDSITVNSSQNIYPAEAPSESTTYYVNVKFDANGGSGAPIVKTASSSSSSMTFTLPSTIPTRSGYIFTGWATSSSASNPQYSAGQSITRSYSTFTLYAVWADATPQVYSNGRFYKTVGTSSVSVIDIGKDDRNYGSSKSLTIYYLPEEAEYYPSFAITSSDTSIVAVNSHERYDYNYHAIVLNCKKPGTAKITVSFFLNNVNYYNEVTINIKPIVRIYKSGWNYYGKYGDAMYTSSNYALYEVNYNGTFDAVWYKVSGSKSNPYCENMVESSGYPGGGTDSVSNITTDRTFYPATAMPRTFTVQISGGQGSVYAYNQSTGQTVPSTPITSGSFTMDAVDGNSIKVYMTPATGYKLTSIKSGSTVLGTVSPYGFVVDSSTEGKTLKVQFDPQTYSVGITSNSNSYGTVDVSSLTVEYGSNITANGNYLTVKNTLVTATPTTFTSTYTYEFDHWEVNGTTLASGSTVQVQGTTTIRAVFTRRSTTYTKDTSAVWKNGAGTSTISSLSVKVDSAESFRFYPSSNLGSDWSVRITDSSGNTVGNATVSYQEKVEERQVFGVVEGVTKGNCYVRFEWRGSDRYYYSTLPLTVIKEWTVTTSCNTGGTIDATDSHVPDGSSKTVRWSANTGYEIYSVKIDNVEQVSKPTSYTWGSVTENHTVEVKFCKVITVPATIGSALNYASMSDYVNSTAKWTVHDTNSEYTCSNLISGLTFSFQWIDSSAYSMKIAGTPAAGTAGNYENVAYESGNGKMFRIIVTVGQAAAHTITLDKNGGASGGSATVHVGDSSLVIGNTPQRTGYDLLHYSMYANISADSSKVANADGSLEASKLYDTTWLTDANGKWAYDGNWTLYTIWKPHEYTVTFNANGGTCSEASRVVKYGDTYDEYEDMPIPTKAGQSFLGWFTSASGGTQIRNSTVVDVDAERTLYAHWADPTEVDQPNSWRLGGYNGDPIDQPLIMKRGEVKEVYWYSAYDVSDSGQLNRWSCEPVSVIGSVSQTKLTTYGSAANVTASGIGTGTVTINWYKVAGDGDSATYYYSELTVQVVLTVTFSGNGGTPSVASMQTRANGTLATLPTATYDATHTFVGWFTQATGGTQIDSTTVFTADTTVYAHWAVGYTIVYDANGGGGGPRYDNAQDAAEYHDFIIPDNVPTKPGETFYEWNSKADGSGIGYVPGDTVRVTSSEPSKTLYAQYAEQTFTFTVHYVASGASNVPADETYQDTVQPYAATVSSTIPTKSGQTFAGWSSVNGATWPEFLPGSRIVLNSGTTTLYAVWDTGSDAAEGAVENVRIFKTIGGAYVDVSGRLAVRSRIHEVENYGATATFTIVNNVRDASENMLSSSYAGWSSGTGALAPGMYVQIRDTDADGYCWGTFMIMSLDVADDLITVTCGDYIQVLRATGAEYYRNIYNGSGYRTDREIGDYGSQLNTIVIDRPTGVNFAGGGAGDVLYMIPEEVSKLTSPTARNTTSLTSRMYLGAYGDPKRIQGIVGIESLTLYLQSAAGTKIEYTISLYAGASTDGAALIYTWNEDIIGQSGTYQETLLELPNPVDLSEFSDMTLQITGRYYSVGDHGDSGWTNAIRVRTVLSTGDRTDIPGLATLTDTCIECKIGALKYHQATGTNTTDQNGPVFEIISIDGLSTIDDQQQLVDLVDLGGSRAGRAWVQYQDATENLSMDTVMSTILKAPDAHLTAVYSTRMVNMFRCGGDTYHSYMLALADMEDEGGTYDGRQHAFCASTTVWGNVNLGVRYRAEDMSQKALYYGGDAAIVGGQIIKTFSPSLSKAGKPAFAMSKGLKNDGAPIMVGIRDPSVGVGAGATAIGSSATTEVDAAFNAYSQIMTNRSTAWEGSLELSGIHSEYMKRAGSWIGGVPITISDSRYGMSSMKVKVRECTVDYQNLITTLVLNNYSEMYANAVLDTTKMAYQAGSMAVVADSTELYTRQYIFRETSTTLPSGSAYSIQIYFDGSWQTEETAVVVKYPELGVCTVVAMLPYGADYSTNSYAVQKVRIKCDNVTAATLDIPEAWRPDRYAGQYLIVNVQMEL